MIRFKEEVAPATPAAGYVRLYAKTDGKLYFKDDTGTEYSVEGLAGATGANGSPGSDFNGSIAASVAGNALTIAVKTKDGSANPSAGSPVTVRFRNVTASNGSVSELSLTAASSLVVSSGSTLGTVNNVPFRFWVVGFNDAGTFRLGIINCVATAAGAGTGRNITDLYQLKAWGIASSSAEGGAGAADSALTFYTGVAVASKAFIVLGYVTYEAGLAAAGTYASAPTRVQTFQYGMPLPGDVLQSQRKDDGAFATFTAGPATIPHDDTIPQITEGSEVLSNPITPTSSANLIRLQSHIYLSTPAASVCCIMALFKNGSSNAIAANEMDTFTATSRINMSIESLILAESSASLTFSVRSGNHTGSTMEFNGSSGGRKMGGVINSYLEILEIMG